MKKRYFLFLLISICSCLVLPAPQTTWYKPIGKYEKIIYRNDNNIDDVYYKLIDNDTITLLSSMNIGYIPNTKHFYFNLKIINNSNKYQRLYRDRLELVSNSLNIIPYLEFISNKNNKIILIPPQDSIYLEYKQLFDLQDKKKYEVPIKKIMDDTISVKIPFENFTYKASFYYNKNHCHPKVFQY